MSAHSLVPDFSQVEIPMDVWSEPFWKAAAERRLLLPKCAHCGSFRWPAGPFCPRCRAQPLDWMPPGQGRLYSYTIMPVPSTDKALPPAHRVAVVIEFDAAAGVRLVSVLIDAPLDSIQIGAAVEPDWLAAANTTVPVFRLGDAGIEKEPGP